MTVPVGHLFLLTCLNKIFGLTYSAIGGADNYEVVCEFYRTTHDRETKRMPPFVQPDARSG